MTGAAGFDWELASGARGAFTPGAQEGLAARGLPAAAPLPGARIGPYRLLEPLGKGSTGVVYRAEGPGGLVALKLLGGSDDPHARERFEREVTTSRSLEHPALVRALDAGQTQGLRWIAFELVEGARPLSVAFAELDPPGRLGLLLQVADGLAWAHARGLAHRDIKPANVLVDRAGRARATDFGLVLRPDQERLTRSQAWVGTPRYMAPEQIRAERDAQGPACDVWALGVCLFEALTREPPFPGESPLELMVQIGGGLRPRLARALPGCDPRLDRVCARALEPDPAARYADAGAFAAALRAALDRPRRAPRRILSLAALAVAVGSLAWTASALRVRPEAAVVARAEALLARDDLAGARRVYEEHLAAAPDSPELWWRLGCVRWRQGDRTAAEAAAARARELDPDHPLAWLLSAWVHTAEGHQAGIRAALVAGARRSAGEGGGDPDAHLVLAVLHAWDGRHDQALASLERALQGARHPGLVLQVRAQVRVAQGERRLALADAEAASAAGVVEPEALAAARGAALLGLGRRAEAEQLLRDAVARWPGAGEVRAVLGQCLLELGQVAEARAQLERALRLTPLNGASWYLLSRAAAALGDEYAADQALERAIELGYFPVLTLRVRAERATRRGELEAALADLGRVLELAPRDATALGLRAALRSQTGDHEGALIDLGVALEVAPQEAGLWGNRGSLLFLARRQEEALACFEEVVARRPDLPEGWNGRGLCRQALDDLPGAKQDYDRCLELQPEHAGARINRGRLRAGLGEVAGARADLTRVLASPSLTPALRGEAEDLLRKLAE